MSCLRHLGTVGFHRFEKAMGLQALWRTPNLKEFKMKHFLLSLLFLPLFVFAQSNNSQINQSALLGTNIGTQATTYNGGYGNTSVTSSNTTQTPTETTSKIYTAPTMYAPGLVATGSDVCLGSASAAGSVLGFGIAAGGTLTDDNCILLKNSARLAQMGFGNAALVLLMNDPKIAAAIKQSTPAVYSQVMKDKAAMLVAEASVAKSFGSSSPDLTDKLAQANREVAVMDLRLKGTGETPQKVNVEHFRLTPEGALVPSSSSSSREILSPPK
jgi:hypothetical protein